MSSFSQPTEDPLTPEPQAAPPALPAARPQPAPGQRSPGLAAVLSFLLPGIGQVYNRQPAKALVFFFGFAGSIYLTADVNPLPFAFLIPFVYFYGIVDAYTSAVALNARGAGTQVEEDAAESPAWGITLIALGLVFLLNNLGWLRLAALSRFWPLILIAAGVAFLIGSIRRRKDGDDGPRL
jgi:hypothetical protein